MAFLAQDGTVVVVRPRDISTVANYFPSHEVIKYNGYEMLALPNTLHTNAVLSKLGMNLGECTHYMANKIEAVIEGKYLPRHGQHLVASFFTTNMRGFCLNKPRTGKTGAAMLAIEYLRREQLAKKTLIISPLTPLINTWVPSIYTTFPHWSVGVLTGSAANRRKVIDNNHDVLLLNPEGGLVIQQELEDLAQAGEVNVILIDECTYYANHKTKRWQALKKLCDASTWVWGMTGTPGSDPEPYYGMVSLINPTKLVEAGKPLSFRAWQTRTMYPVHFGKQVEGQSRYRVGGFVKWFAKQNAQEDIKRVMTPSIKIDSSDILPTLYVKPLKVEMSKEQVEAYRIMKRDAAMLVDGKLINAVNAAVLSNKLMQIATGICIPTGSDPLKDLEATVHLDCEPRFKALEYVMTQGEYKTLVFAPYRANLDMLEEWLKKRGTKYVRIDGSVIGNTRNERLTQFQTDIETTVLIGHPKTVQMGIELGMADTLVFWGPPQNGDVVYSQAKDRIGSPIQKSKFPTIYQMHSIGAEQVRFQRLEDQTEYSLSTADMFRIAMSEKV